MDTNWIEYKCKSGQTLFIYNKVTGEHKWPTYEVGFNSFDEKHSILMYLISIGTESVLSNVGRHALN